MTIKEAFNEAEELYCSIPIDGNRVMFYKGYKAIKTPEGGVKVFDTTKGGATYDELTPGQYAVIEKYGWKSAVIKIKEQ